MILKKISKYSRLFKAFARASFVADLEYRANFISRIVTDIFWYLAQIITFETLFLHTDKIGDWNRDQMRVFLGILFVVDAFYMIFFHDNFEKMTDRVRKGEMDLLLAKPVNSQFMLSVQRVSTAMVGNLLIGMGWLAYALYSLDDFSPLRLLWMIILVPCGLLSLYAARFMFASMTVIFTKSDNIQYLWYQMYKLGMRPDSMYFPWLKFLILTVFPVGIIASVPARAILNPPDYWLFLWVVVWTAALLYMSHRFWNFCLKHYSSASS